MANYRFPEPGIIYRDGEKLQNLTSDAGICIAKTAQRIRNTESEGAEMQEKAQERIQQLESLLQDVRSQRAEAEQRFQSTMEAAKQAESLMGRLNSQVNSLIAEIKALQARNANRRPGEKNDSGISAQIQQKMFELRQVQNDLKLWGTRLETQLKPKLMQEQTILTKIRAFEAETQNRSQKLTAVKSRLDASLHHLSSWVSEWENSENQTRKKALTEGMGETGMELISLSDQIRQYHWGANHG